MKRRNPTRRNLLVITMACLLFCNPVQAKKPGKPPGGGNGGGTPAPFQLVDLVGLPVTDLPNFSQSVALSVNEPDNNGTIQVVGDSHTRLTPSVRIHPALWEIDIDGSVTTTDLGLPPQAWEATATDVNDWGVITINTVQGDPPRPSWVSVPGLALQELPFVGESSDAFAINNFNEIVGTHANTTGALWQLDAQGVPSEPLDTGTNFIPSDTSDSAVMAGTNEFFRPAIAFYDNGVLVVQPLDTSRASLPGTATSISPDGSWVVGWIGGPVGGGGNEQAFRWSAATGITPLGRLGGEASVALGVNNAGQVVGWSNTNDSKQPQTAFLWEDGQMLDLDTLADTGRKIQLTEATSINHAGHIVGAMEVVSKGSIQLHAFALLPQAP